MAISRQLLYGIDVCDRGRVFFFPAGFTVAHIARYLSDAMKPSREAGMENQSFPYETAFERVKVVS